MITTFAPIPGLIGGVLIGLGAVFLMITVGRIAGVCGIAMNSLMPVDSSGRWWRLAFMAGLPLGAMATADAGWKDWSAIEFTSSLPMMAIAGFIVGAAATVGSGCTSGHGICGMARLSPRSIVATATFVTAGIVTVYIIRHLV